MAKHHGLCGKFKSEYARWKAMKRRCYSRTDKHFHDYAGRGIIVCDRWLASFPNFIDDMGKCPTGFSLERINNNGNYEPGNCVWADKYQQARNKRNVPMIRINGEMTPACVVARSNGIKRSTFAMRIHYGWNIEDAATKPCRGER